MTLIGTAVWLLLAHPAAWLFGMAAVTASAVSAQRRNPRDRFYQEHAASIASRRADFDRRAALNDVREVTIRSRPAYAALRVQETEYAEWKSSQTPEGRAQHAEMIAAYNAEMKDVAEERRAIEVGRHALAREEAQLTEQVKAIHVGPRPIVPTIDPALFDQPDEIVTRLLTEQHELEQRREELQVQRALVEADLAEAEQKAARVAIRVTHNLASKADSKDADTDVQRQRAMLRQIVSKPDADDARAPRLGDELAARRQLVYKDLQTRRAAAEQRALVEAKDAVLNAMAKVTYALQLSALSGSDLPPFRAMNLDSPEAYGSHWLQKLVDRGLLPADGR